MYLTVMFVLSCFSKSFDIDMCPLPFTLEKMYSFISDRFTDPSAYVQEQALQWLQVRNHSENKWKKNSKIFITKIFFVCCAISLLLFVKLLALISHFR